MSRLVFEELCKDYTASQGGVIPALSDFSLAVETGEFVVVVGPSGGGKTTLLRLIAGLEQSTRGRMTLDGRDLSGVPPQNRDVAMVFQHHALLPHLTVAQNLGLGLKLRKTPRAETERRVRETAELLGLTDCLDRLPKDISGGQRQRVALGRAMARRPKVFLFDEPLASLDTPLRILMRQEIRRLHAQTRATSLYVTHDQTEALALGQRLAVLHEGRLQQVDGPHMLYRRPANRMVAAFLGSPAMNFIPGRLERDAAGLVFIPAQAIPGLIIPKNLEPALQAWADQPVELGLRPEHLSLAAADPKHQERLTIKCRLLAIEPLGPDTQLQLQWGAINLTARADCGGVCPLPGTEIQVGIDLMQSHWFDPQTGRRIGGG